MKKSGWILLDLIFLGIFLGTVTVSIGATAEPYSQTVQRVSRLRPGTYVGEAGADDACVDGPLTFRDQPDGRVTIFLNGHMIIPSVGEPESGVDQNLRWTSSSDLSDRRIVWRRDGVLGTKPVHWQTTLTVHDGGFTYAFKYKGKPVTCVLTLRR